MKEVWNQPHYSLSASHRPELGFISTNMISADSLEIECCNEMDAAIIGSRSKMNWRRGTAQTAVYIQPRYLKCSQLE